VACTAASQPDVLLLDIRQSGGQQPIAEVPVNLVGPVLEFVRRDLVQQLAAFLRVPEFDDEPFGESVSVSFDELDQPDSEHELPPGFKVTIPAAPTDKRATTLPLL